MHWGNAVRCAGARDLEKRIDNRRSSILRLGLVRRRPILFLVGSSYDFRRGIARDNEDDAGWVDKCDPSELLCGRLCGFLWLGTVGGALGVLDL